MTTTRKILAIILAVLSVFSISVPAFATAEEVPAITESKLDLFRKYEDYLHSRLNLEKDVSCYDYAAENSKIIKVEDNGTVFVKGIGTTILTATDKETGEIYTVKITTKLNLGYIVNVLSLGLFFSPVKEEYRQSWQILAF